MVPGGVRYHTGHAFRELKDGVGSSTSLEGPDLLQILGLEEDARIEFIIKSGRSEYWCSMNKWSDTNSCSFHIRVGDREGQWSGSSLRGLVVATK